MPRRTAARFCWLSLLTLLVLPACPEPDPLPDDDDTTVGDDDDGATSMFFLRFAPEACCGIQSLGITTDRIGNLETKDAKRTRIKWYPGLMLQSLISCSKVTGIDADGTVAA